MRICFFSGDITRSGGTERVLSTLTEGLLSQPNPHDYSILSLEMENSRPFFHFNEKITLANLNIVEKMSPFKKMSKVINGIHNYVIENTIDIFIDVDTILSVYSVPALAFTKIKQISWEHFTYQQDLGVRYRNWGRRIAGLFADGIVVLTQKDQRQYMMSGHVRRPVHHIYNPVIIHDANQEQKVFEQKMILSAGRLTYQKGFDLLIDVAERVFQEHPDWIWVIAGEGNDREALEQKIREKHLEEHVLLPGAITNMEDYYQQASMFVLTSRFEPFGLVLTEAKSFHLPCISFDVDSGPAEIILDDVNGYLIAPFNIEEMANKINFLIEHPEIRHYQAMNAMMDTEKFNLNYISHEWEKLFESLI